MEVFIIELVRVILLVFQNNTLDKITVRETWLYLLKNLTNFYSCYKLVMVINTIKIYLW